MSVNFSPCVLIPCYNHGAMMPGVLARLKPFNLPCIVVDDGSDAATQQQLDSLLAEQPGVTLIRLAENAGKGAAVMYGLQAAKDAGFSHAVQVDADGQHAIEDIPKLLAVAEQHPAALISGQPIYDDSIPPLTALRALGHPRLGMDRNALPATERQHVRFSRLSGCADAATGKTRHHRQADGFRH
ncbi:glycosyltransferase family 2 protein [Escherichia coli]|nr:glycosyltransferase family 2 protein [Escherichia coli]